MEGSTSYSSINVHHDGGEKTMVRCIMIYPYSKKLTNEGTPLHCPTSSIMNNNMCDENIHSSEIYLMIVSSHCFEDRVPAHVPEHMKVPPTWYGGFMYCKSDDIYA